MPIRGNALAIMAKAPLAGLVKTRLVPPLTQEQAAQLCRALLLDQLENLKAPDSADRFLAYAPDDAEALMRQLGGDDFHYLAQSSGDLGARMNHVFSDLFRCGYRRIVLIGSDLPALPLAILHDAFSRLDGAQRRVVLGPSRDGGYYLVGMNRPTPQVFENMTWSHDRVLTQTTKRLTQLGIAYDLIASWFDVDSLDDLRRLRSLGEPPLHQAMSRTLSYLDQLNQLGCLDEQA